MRQLRFILRLAICGLALAFATPTFADQAMDVVLQSATGDEVVIADLMVDEDGGYSLTFRDAAFDPYFLSMRPFKCLTAPPRLQCYLPYPYEKTRKISKSDLGDLEYDLLFLVKQVSEFGVNFWNGRYYRLHWEGDAIVGKALATDMNIIASKPPAGVTRPIGTSDLSEIAPSDTPYPSVRIQPVKEE